jgi:hypothetical protein
MRILIEEHPYEATDEILKVVCELGPTINIEGKVSVGYVGYYYNTSIEDCVFILPKVLIDEAGKVFGNYEPSEIVNLEGEKNPLKEDERKFIYELSVWIYRAISVFKERNKDSKIVLHGYCPKKCVCTLTRKKRIGRCRPIPKVCNFRVPKL